jgi:hypothetical protein
MRARGVSGKLRIRRLTRHWGEALRVTDERDMGNRPGVAKALGLVDADFVGPPEHDADSCMTFGCPACLGLVSGGER